MQEGIEDTVMHLNTKDDFEKASELFYKEVCHE